MADEKEACLNRKMRAAIRRGRLKVAEETALPPDLRKASGFPRQTASLLLLSSAGRLSLPAEPKGLLGWKPSERQSLSAHQAAEPPATM